MHLKRGGPKTLFDLTGVPTTQSKGMYFDELSYKYEVADPIGPIPYDDRYNNQASPDAKLKRNKLYHVNDASYSNLTNLDIDDISIFNGAQLRTNVDYDAVGNLTRDNLEEIENIDWDVYGKIKSITRNSSSGKKDLFFTYDAMGNRLSKESKLQGNNQDIERTYYARDASGNVMANYLVREVYNEDCHCYHSNSDIEYPMYGSSRLGVKHYYPSAESRSSQEYVRILGQKDYELTDHLGNVTVTVSDRKLGYDLQGNPAIADYYKAEVTSAQDYYPFGMLMPGRIYSSNTYRYGFNGMEKDDEVKGSGGHLDYEARGRDTRLGGGWWSVDPLASKYAGISPYAYCFNNPNIYVDKDGKDAILIVFPDYKIDPEIKLVVNNPFTDKPIINYEAPKVGGLGHAGVLLIDNKTGVTKYYEYGRYKTKDGTKGIVHNIPVSNVIIGADGKPTPESLNKVLGQISQKSGHGGKIDGAYIISDQFKAMNDYAQQKFNESNPGSPNYNKDRAPYTLSGNNCGTFAADVINQDPCVDQPSIFNPTPQNIVEEYQEEGNAQIQYNPLTNTTTIGEGDEDDAKDCPDEK